MSKRGFLRASGALLLVLILLAAWQGPRALALWRGWQAYVYAYPMLTTEMTRRVQTAPASWQAERPKPGAGALNRLHHARTIPDADYRDIVAPNADTLYSIAWMDLGAEPLVLHQPEMGNRYLLLPLLDAWSNVFASLGTREYGSAARDYLIAGPGWQGQTPAGMTRVDAPTRYVMLIGRTKTGGKPDYAAVHALQDQYTLRTLSGAEPPLPDLSAAPVDIKTAVVRQVADLDVASYYSWLARAMANNPPAAADAPMVALLADLGIRAGQPFDPSKLEAGALEGLQAGRRLAQAVFEERSAGTQADPATGWLATSAAHVLNTLIDKSLNRSNGWLMPLTLGTYDTRYLQRAIVSLVGFGANRAIDAVYPMAEKDSDGEFLDSAHRYRLQFAPRQLPPANAFWSLTLYDEAGFFVANEIGRFAIGDRDPLQLNADGGVDLIVQRQRPAEGGSNWLPAPQQGRFKLMLRVFAPKAELLDGRWSPPAVQRLPDPAR